MVAARRWCSAALISFSFAGCLFPDYEAVGAGGASGASGGQLGTAGTGAAGGATGGTSGTGGTGGTSAAGGTSGTGGAAGGTEGNAGTGGNLGSNGSGSDACTADGCPPPERCTDGVDDDGDGKTDCFDSDCVNEPACRGKCMEADELPCNSVRTDKNSGATGSTSRIAPPVYSCVTAEHAGPEFAYRVTGAADSEVFVQLYGLDGNLDVMLVDDTSGMACNAQRDCTTAGNAYNDTRPEALGFVAAAGHNYFVVVDGPARANYSLSIACAPAGGCKPARSIQAGQTIVASTMLGSSNPNVTQNVNRYDCLNMDRTGPEAAFFFTPTEAGSYVVRLDNLSANVDLFVLAAPSCNGSCYTSSSFSANPARQAESVTLPAAADISYYIVVDGPNAAPTTFDLSVTKL